MKLRISFNIAGQLLVILSLMISCELDEDGSIIYMSERIEGQWKAEETSQLFKRKATDNLYYVYITPFGDDKQRITISNFYHLGDETEAIALISGNSLTFARQNLPGGFIVLSGSGTISSNRKTINLSYDLDDGSGVADRVTAVYTKID